LSDRKFSLSGAICGRDFIEDCTYTWVYPVPGVASCFTTAGYNWDDFSEMHRWCWWASFGRFWSI